jgi:hypothetical protein
MQPREINLDRVPAGSIARLSTARSRQQPPMPVEKHSTNWMVTARCCAYDG